MEGDSNKSKIREHLFVMVNDYYVNVAIRQSSMIKHSKINLTIFSDEATNFRSAKEAKEVADRIGGKVIKVTKEIITRQTVTEIE